MNSDIRLSVDFFSHHKTKKVLRKIGPEGVICLVRLLCYVGKFRPEGRLEWMDVEGISDAVDWSGDAEELVSTLCGAGFIEQSDDGVYIIHDWEKHNPWAPYRDWETDRKSTRLNSSHSAKSRMPSSA